MHSKRQSLFLFAILAACFVTLFSAETSASDRYLEVAYPPSTETNELSLGVTYRLWLPDGVKTVRGVVVHQHGCGVGSRKGAEPGARDLHWQALCRKWDCALLMPSYHQEEKDNCRLWCDPRNGSHKTFLKCLADFSAQSGHPELERAPWCLWGHSGGGFWSSLMQTMYPERIVAIWFRSGTAFEYWEKGEVTKPDIPDAAMGIPMMCNPGAKENGNERFKSAWTGTLAMFKAYRAKGAPIGFAPDPRTRTRRVIHAISRFHSSMRASRSACQTRGATVQSLKPVDQKQAWLAPLLGEDAQPAAKFSGDLAESVWLPRNRSPSLGAIREDRRDGRHDATSGTDECESPVNPEGIELTWDAEADFESGLPRSSSNVMVSRSRSSRRSRKTNLAARSFRT